MTDLTLTEAAAVVGVTPRQLRHAVVTGKLRARTVGRAYVVARADLDAWQPPAPGASLDAYWRARGKRGKSPVDKSTTNGPESGVSSGKNPVDKSPEYAPAIIKCEAGLMPAEVLLCSDGCPERGVVDFGVLKAQWSGDTDGRGRFTFYEV